MKKIISIILIVLIIMGIITKPTKSEATFTMDKAKVYSKGLYKDYLRWNGMGIIFNYVVYEDNGQEYPAYCLNKDLDGATLDFTYSVGTDKLLTDVKVWRTIINGYPYKTPEELGCKTKEEAFLATKQAVYCTLYNRDPYTYIANDAVGERTRTALINIVTNARKSTEVKASADLTIEEINKKWEHDGVDKKYISKEFAIKANSTINSYFVELEGIKIEGAKIVDENNKEKNEFKFGEKFKIIIPITNMQNSGSFNIKVNGKVATKPIIYGYSTVPNLQDYALTGEIYEEGRGVKTVNYIKNETKIVVIKQDEFGNALEGVKFRLLDENKEILYTELTTDEEGRIIIENISPGVYYLEETSTVNGYAIYEEQILAEVDYNEELTVKVTNSKETIMIEEPEMEQKEQEVVVKLPKTGM